MAKFSEKLGYFWDILISRPKTGAIQITDAFLQYVLIDRNKINSFSLKIPPGILNNGIIQNRDYFISLLRQLHRLIKPGKDKEKIKVIVNVPAELVFSQSFNLPNIDSELMNESAKLNLQMLSPIQPEKAYLSWQKINETLDQIEFLGAIAERKKIDDLSQALEEANFKPVAVEFPALALTRFINKFLMSETKTYIVLHISSDGLDLFILKNGQLYFDHFRSWKSIQGDNRQITRSFFEATVVEEVQRVLNFALNYFKEKLSQIILIAPGFEEEIKKLLETTFGLETIFLDTRGFTNLGPSWYVVLGSAVRGTVDRSKDQEITLTQLTPIEEYYQEQVLSFTILWRNIILGMMAIFLIIFIGIDIFLIDYYKKTQDQLATFKSQEVLGELEELKSKAQEFNDLVDLIEKEQGPQKVSWLEFLNTLTNLTASYNIKIERLLISSLEQPIQLNGIAPSKVSLLDFKEALSKKNYVKNVELPLPSISILEDNSVAFSLNFNYQPQK